MVKNSGGCRTKGLARKLVNAPVSDKVRQIEEEGEYYAIVSKMLGNGMCHVNVLQDDEIIPNVALCLFAYLPSLQRTSENTVPGESISVSARTLRSYLRDRGEYEWGWEWCHR